MAKNKSAAPPPLEPAPAEEARRYVRLYFGLTLHHLLPKRPPKDPDGRTPAQWRNDVLQQLVLSLGVWLGEGFDRPYIESFTRQSEKYPLYTVKLNISSLRSLPGAAFYEGYKGLDIRVGPFRALRDKVRAEIESRVQENFHVAKLAFEWVASRNFVFDVYFRAKLAIKYAMPDDEVADWGIKGALDNFATEVQDIAKERCGVKCVMRPYKRRPKSNVYWFDFEVLTRCWGFMEDGVKDGINGGIALRNYDYDTANPVPHDVQTNDYDWSRDYGEVEGDLEGGFFELRDGAEILKCKATYVGESPYVDSGWNELAEKDYRKFLK